MRDFIAITKALADENRVRALLALAGGELCVCQIIELLCLAPSTVSKHMTLLHQARLVETRKEGRWVYYRLADRAAGSHAQAALDMTLECLQKDNQVREDARRVRSIRKMAREKLCKLRQD